MRVCAYCRVSTDKDDQINSFENQQEYFEKYINQHPGWVLTNIYADEGITGTSTAKRNSFNQMIKDAHNGKFDLILTKEVSRFARNTVDTLQYTRELKNIDVRIIFLIDNIDTFDTDGEFRLTIMASIAQEESRKTSERVKWGISQQMKRGFVYSPSLLGYDVKKGKISINQNEAKTVKTIFHKFAYDNQSANSIARELTMLGVKPVKRMKTWSSTTIIRILKNEKYVGDLIQRKKYVKNFLDHKCVKNNDISTMFFEENHHEAIIDRRTWDLVQDKLNSYVEDGNAKTKASNNYWCSGKIRCGICGKNFSVKSKKLSSGSLFLGWKCINRIKFGSRKIDGLGNEVGCNNTQINQKALRECIKYACDILIENQNIIIESLKKELGISDILSGACNGDVNCLNNQKEKLETKRKRAVELFVDGFITKEELTTMKNEYTVQIMQLNKEIEQMNNSNNSDIVKQRIQNISNRIDDIIKTKDYQNDIFFAQIIQQIIAYPNKLEIYFKNISMPFVIDYKTHGRGDNYQVCCSCNLNIC